MKLLDISTPKNPNAFTKFDDIDFDWLNQWKWRLDSTGYAVRTKPNSGKEKILLHRFLVNTPKGMFTDHINGDRLDNQKMNIRYCSRAENNRNRSKCITSITSKYKGVYKSYNRYQTSIIIDGKKRTFYSNDEIEAAKIYNDMALKYYGDFAKLNAF